MTMVLSKTFGAFHVPPSRLQQHVPGRMGHLGRAFLICCASCFRFGGFLLSFSVVLAFLMAQHITHVRQEEGVDSLGDVHRTRNGTPLVVVRNPLIRLNLRYFASVLLPFFSTSSPIVSPLSPAWTSASCTSALGRDEARRTWLGLASTWTWRGKAIGVGCIACWAHWHGTGMGMGVDTA